MEVLKDDAFEIGDVAIDEGENPYYIQNLLNVMNNRKVDQSTERKSMERSLEKRETNNTTVIAEYSNYAIRQDIASKIANVRNERLDKSPVMKYLSITLLKKNGVDSSKRQTSTSKIKFHNYNPKCISGSLFEIFIFIEKEKSLHKRTFEAKKEAKQVEGRNNGKVWKPRPKVKDGVKHSRIQLYPSKFGNVSLVFVIHQTCFG
jgi:hypothetical protein